MYNKLGNTPFKHVRFIGCYTSCHCGREYHIMIIVISFLYTSTQ